MSLTPSKLHRYNIGQRGAAPASKLALAVGNWPFKR